MDIIEIFITADSDHICIESLAVSKAVFLKGVAFPFGKRVYDLGIFFLSFDVEAYRTFYTIQVIVKTGRW